MTVAKNIEGHAFGRWRVIARFHELVRGRRRFYWMCECDCGTRKLVNGYYLLNGTSRSCGCSRAERAKALKRTHGMSATREYRTWQRMILRCYSPKNADYRYYGARGISVSHRWRKSFENFLSDMGNRPGPNFSIERKDNNKGYTKRNCKWATAREQVNNRRVTIRVKVEGKLLPLSVACEQLGLCRNKVYRRIWRGMPTQRALTLVGAEK